MSIESEFEARAPWARSLLRACGVEREDLSIDELRPLIDLIVDAERNAAKVKAFEMGLTPASPQVPGYDSVVLLMQQALQQAYEHIDKLHRGKV